MKVFLHCNSTSSRLDPQIAYETSLLAEAALREEGHDVFRFLPLGKKETFTSHVHQMKQTSVPAVSIFFKCRPLSACPNERASRIRVLLGTSTFDISTLGQTLFDYLGFWTVNPMWLITSREQDYYLLKHSVLPVNLDLGIYETCEEARSISNQAPGAINALVR